jgi:hypothetical protein
MKKGREGRIERKMTIHHATIVDGNWPGTATLSADSRLGALNPLLDQIWCRKQTINIQGLINAVEHVDEDCEQGMKP